jgi:hypothetical protein
LSKAKFNIRASSNISGSTQHSAKRRHDIQHNDAQHNDIHHKDTQRIRLICNTQHNDIHHKDTQRKRLICNTQHNSSLSIIMLNVTFYLLLC